MGPAPASAAQVPWWGVDTPAAWKQEAVAAVSATNTATAHLKSDDILGRSAADHSTSARSGDICCLKQVTAAAVAHATHVTNS